MQFYSSFLNFAPQHHNKILMISGLQNFGSILLRTLQKSFGHFSENVSESPNIVRKSFILLEANLRYYSENHNNINLKWCVSGLSSGTGDTTD